MFFMCFWPFILLCHTSQFLLFEGFALLHWCYFLLHLKTDIKGPLLFLLKKLTYPLQTIFESLFWMYLLHLILRPPPPPLLSFHLAFPTDVNASMKQVKITVKNLLRYFLYSAIILGRGRDCIFSRDREGEAACCMATSYWLHVKVWGSQFRLEVTNTLLTPDQKKNQISPS